jgi:dihydrofolate reductase
VSPQQQARMSRLTANISISLDGFVAGPNQSVENPIGEGGMQLHQWAFATRAWNEQQGRDGGEPGPDSDVIQAALDNVGAYIMGRNMFGGGSGPWETSWTGWWGEEPPFHVPVFVLTHHPREPLPLEGGTTFTFVTDGIDAALEQARAAAGDRDVRIAGGASAIRQYLAAGLLDELQLHVVPVLLGAGERLLDGAGDPVLEPAEAIGSPAVTHLRYRVVRPGG